MTLVAPPPRSAGGAPMQPVPAPARWTGTTIRAARRPSIRWGDVLAPYLFIAPFILSFVVLFLGPAIYSLVLSFYKFKGYGNASWKGLDNYRTILEYHVFW